MKLIVRRLARRDIAEAVRWYRTRSEDVARVFLDALEGRLKAIERTPERFPIVHADVRRALLGRFPYGLYFREVGQELRIIACTHLRRHPRRWQRRR